MSVTHSREGKREKGTGIDVCAWCTIGDDLNDIVTDLFHGREVSPIVHCTIHSKHGLFPLLLPSVLVAGDLQPRERERQSQMGGRGGRGGGEDDVP
jgi:hypothetical protein